MQGLITHKNRSFSLSPGPSIFMYIPPPKLIEDDVLVTAQHHRGLAVCEEGYNQWWTATKFFSCIGCCFNLLDVIATPVVCGVVVCPLLHVVQVSDSLVHYFVHHDHQAAPGTPSQSRLPVPQIDVSWSIDRHSCILCVVVVVNRS